MLLSLLWENKYTILPLFDADEICIPLLPIIYVCFQQKVSHISTAQIFF